MKRISDYGIENYVLFLPMRGYEVMAKLSDMIVSNVISPHEGL
ncbi:Uncharacterized protein dnm_042690 [Desulfonema magnum]|uniref:Uncharacterized protein n=1 Tax=Desulfonema magnum TaxID=45655 RepID=A0A975GNX6_9BACT|nr:Uncharacterized protein dnm_042690 [Desulfonema magnum]